MIIGFILVCAGLWWFFYGPHGTERKVTPDNMKEIKIRGEYVLKVPKYMQMVPASRPFVSLHMENRSKEIYLEIEEHDLGPYSENEGLNLEQAFQKAVTLYWKLQMESNRPDVETNQKEWSEPRRLDQGMLEAVQFDTNLDNPSFGPDSYIHHILYKGKGKMYILTLVTNTRFRDRYSEVFHLITGSFQLLDIQQETLAI